MENILFQLGEYGPYIIFFLKYYTIRPAFRKQFFQLIFFNIIINTLLKYIIQEKRPIPNTEYIIASNYGMPSLHSQLSIFMALYRYTDIESIYLNSIILALVSWISIQRIYSGNHSLKQVIVGLCIGILLVYYLT